jgi:predicted GIY-YIG superfamily endonuclease
MLTLEDTLIYVYILQSIDGTYHTGCCDELAIVLAKYNKYKKLLHGNKINLSVRLVHQQKFKSEPEIIDHEIRKWSYNS